MTPPPAGTYRAPTMRFAILSLELALLAGCASSGTGTPTHASGVSGLNNASQSLFVTSGSTGPQAPRNGLRGPRAMRGLRGLRAPSHNRFAPNNNRAYANNSEPSISYQDYGKTIDVQLGGYGFQRVDRSFWIGPGQGPLTTPPHTVGQTGQSPSHVGTVTYDPVTRSFRFNER